MLMVCLGALLAASVVFVALYCFVPPPGTPLMLLRLAEGYGINKDWQKLDSISPNLVRAVISGEDEKFCLHHGFDWDAIDTAWQRYQTGRGPLHGASTISMQTAKNVFLWPGRDWVRKALEAYFTVLIEFGWGKRRILEMYLNVVEWGPGIYGAQAAAEHYFRKPAAALTGDEAARLAAILPDPLDRSARRLDRETAAHAAFIRDHMPEVPVGRPLPCGG